MTSGPAGRPAAILLDIEGTTSPLRFVHDVLFPFARAHLRDYLGAPANAARLDDIAAGLKAEGEWHGSIEASLQSLMDRDVKSPTLKSVQGWIWEQGFRTGELAGEVYPDVAPAIRRWRAAGCQVAIYSSGSVLAQKLLFASTPDGDLTPLIDAFFDTAAGPKVAASSYRTIARALGQAPGRILFISDVTRELAAARAAGLQVRLAMRPGNTAQPDASGFPPISSFDELA